MYVSEKDSNGNLYFNPVAEGSTSTNVTLTIEFPTTAVSSLLTTIDNITIDMVNWNMYVGSYQIDAFNALQIASKILSETTPSRFLTKDEFIIGLSEEIEKLVIFSSNIILCEHRILAAIKCISELKGLGLY
jgi:hypothetical protein